MDDEKPMQWWFWFRQVIPQPPGQWVLCGPYATYEKADRERTRSKAWDAEVSVHFAATTKEEAEKRSL